MGKLEFYIFEEGGRRRSFSLNKGILYLFFALLVILITTSGVSIYMGYKINKENRLLEERLNLLLKENNSLKERVARLTRERRKIIEVAALDLQKKASILLKLKKNYGVEFREFKGVGGIYLPFDYDNIDIVRILKKIYYYENILKTIPLGKPLDRKIRITSGFGFRIDPFTGKRAFHPGIDIIAPKGTPVRVTADGIVSFSGYRPDYGKFVLVLHKNGFSTLYAHLSKIFVRSGQKLRKGDIIGLVGSTGRSTGPHLHYEVRLRGRYLNPEEFLGVD